MTSVVLHVCAVLLVLVLGGDTGAYAAHDAHGHDGDACRICNAVRAEAAPTTTAPVLAPAASEPEVALPTPAGRPKHTFPRPWSARAPPILPSTQS